MRLWNRSYLQSSANAMMATLVLVMLARIFPSSVTSGKWMAPWKALRKTAGRAVELLTPFIRPFNGLGFGAPPFQPLCWASLRPLIEYLEPEIRAVASTPAQTLQRHADLVPGFIIVGGYYTQSRNKARLLG